MTDSNSSFEVYSKEIDEKLRSFLEDKLQKITGTPDSEESNWGKVAEEVRSDVFQGYKVELELNRAVVVANIKYNDDCWVELFWLNTTKFNTPNKHFNDVYNWFCYDATKKKIALKIMGIVSKSFRCTESMLRKCVDEFPKIIEEFEVLKAELEKQTNLKT